MLVSILRTFIPYIWGIFIGSVLSAVPVLEPLRDQLLSYGELSVPVIAAILAGLWYALWRWLEPRLPDWLTRILLGSAKAPNYETATGANEEFEDPILRRASEVNQKYPEE